MRILLLAAISMTLNGCGIMAANRMQEEQWAKRDQALRNAEAARQRDDTHRANVAKLEEGMTFEEVEALIGPYKLAELIQGKKRFLYYAGGYPMNLTYSKAGKLTGWEVNQASLDRVQRARANDELIDSQEEQGRLNRQQQLIQSLATPSR